MSPVIAMVDVTRPVSLHKFHLSTLHGRDMLDRSDRDAARQALGGEDARMCDDSAGYEIRLIVRPVVRLPCCVLWPQETASKTSLLLEKQTLSRIHSTDKLANLL